MPPQSFIFEDFSGGWVAARHASRLADNQLRDLRNFVVGPDGQLITRPPLRRSITKVTPTVIYGLNIVRGETSDVAKRWGLLVGSDGGSDRYFSFVNTTTLTALTDRDSFATLDPYPNIKIVRYKDIYYVFGDGVSNLFGPIDFVVRCDVHDTTESDFQQAGISLPSAGPTVAAAAGGSLPNATYQCVVSFFNSRTGCESFVNVTPSSVTTSGANNQISWTAIPTASGAGTGAAQVTSRKLYRTLPNQTNEYYLVTTINDNTTTIYTDNVGVASLGARALQFGRTNYTCGNLGALSGGGVGAVIWRERLWFNATLATSGLGTALTALLYSQVGQPEMFAVDSFIPIGTNDASLLTGIAAADEYLLVFKGTSIWRVTGTSPSNFSAQELRSPTGLSDSYAVAASPAGIFFLGSDGYFYVTDGYSVRRISEGLGRLNLHSYSTNEIQSVVWPARNLFLTLQYRPIGDADPGTTVYAYDYVKQAWSYWDVARDGTHEVPRPRCFNLGYNELARQSRLYVGGQRDANAYVCYFDDDLYTSSDNNTDQSPVTESTNTDFSPTRSVRTKDFDLFKGEAFMVNQVWVRIAWDTSIVSASSPDTNYPLAVTAALVYDSNTGVAADVTLASKAVSISTEDRANEQWFPLGLQTRQAVSSVGLKLDEAAGAAPRRHAITGIRFDATRLRRGFVQPGQTLSTNVA